MSGLRFVTHSFRRALGLLLVTMSVTASAVELDERCTVSVLNRTAQVDAEGRWIVRNVPSSMGLVRARAICVQNGMTLVGQSDFFTVPTDGVVTVREIQFQEVRPAPAVLQLTAERSTLANIGDTLALRATSILPDGSVRDVTAGATGTTYRSSNPSIISVSSDGVAAAVGSGTVILSALHDGALGLFRLAVATGPLDSDGDGMPDEWETTYGLNPNDPGDAAGDLDADGLSNLAEFNAGTDPSLPDSDGDGVRDGLEIQTGSDPLDPASFNLPAALQSISIAPSPISMSINGLVGESYRVVSVIGSLRDGTFIDLTARSLGTSYSTVHPQFAFVGAVDGQIFAGSPGTTTLNVTSNGFSASAPVTVTSFTPVLRGNVLLPGYGNEVVLSGLHCYVASGAGGLQIVNIANMALPQIAGSYPTRGNSNGVALDGNLAYVADGTGGVLIVDVSVPSAPQIAGAVDTPGVALQVAVENGMVYVADGAAGLQVIDATDPATARIIATVALGATRSIDIEDGLLAVGLTTGIVRLVDVSSPAAPALRGTAAAGSAINVKLRGTHLFSAGEGAGFYVIDVSDADAPFVASVMTASGEGPFYDVGVNGGYVFGAVTTNSIGTRVIDARDPAAPVRRTTLVGASNSSAVDVSSTLLVRIAGSFQTKPAVTGTTRLYVWQYADVTDLGARGPQVSLVTPAATASPLQGTTIQAEASAIDDVGVVRVEFLLNGRVAGAANTAPYRVPLRLPLAPLTVDLAARAVDYAGNVTTTPVRTLTLTSDTTPPTVVSNSGAGLMLPGGTNFNIHVSATDDVGVRFVELYVDGVLYGTGTSAPYNFGVQLPNQTVQIPIYVRAVDLVGNETITPTRFLNVVENIGPTASIILPTAATVVYDAPKLLVRANAQDDTRVSRVDLVINGTVRQSKTSTTTSYWEFLYDVPSGGTSLSIAIVAVDEHGQSGSSPTVTLPIKPASLLGSTIVPGVAWDMSLMSDYAYVAARSSGLQIVNIANPQSPAVVGSVDTPGSANALLAAGRYVYIADGAPGLQVADVSTPSAPVLVASLTTFGDALSLTRRGDRLYVGTSLGVQIVDIRNPLVLRRSGMVAFETIETGRYQSVPALAVADDLLFFVMRRGSSSCTRCAAVYSYSLTNPDVPVHRSVVGPTITGVRTRMEVGDFLDIAVRGSMIYVPNEDAVYAVQHTNGQLSYRGVYFTDFLTYGFSDIAAVSGSLGISAWAQRSTNNVAFFDLTSPSTMFMNGMLSLSSFGAYHGTSIAATPELFYTTGTSVYRDDISNEATVTSRIYAARYETVADTLGAAPSVTISAPAAAYERESVPVTISATDDKGVATVALSLDGSVVATDRIAPYEFSVPMPPGAASRVFTATATDFAGNQASATAPVNVTADVVPPAVTLTTPRNGQSVPGGGVHLHVEATDDFTVARVEYLINGQVAATDTAWPYDYDYAIPAGMTTITAAARAVDASGNSAESDTRTVTVVAPQLLSMFDLPGIGNDVDINGNYAYVAAGASGLLIVDITDLAAPQQVGSITFPGSNNQAETVTVHGTYAFVGLRFAGTSIVDVRNPAQPAIVPVTISGGLNGYYGTVDGLDLFTAGDTSGGTGTATGQIYDLTDINRPVRRATWLWSGAIRALSIGRRNAPVYTTQVDTSVLRRSTSSLTLVASTGTPSSVGLATGAAAQDDFVLIGTEKSLIATETTEYFRTRTILPTVALADVDMLDQYAIAATAATPARALLYDVTDRAAPAARGTLDFTAYGSYALARVAMTPTHVVGVARSSANQTRLMIARYRTFTDTNGQPPSVTMTAAATATKSRLYPIEAAATDDVGVKAVVFRIDGVDVFTDTIAPYQYNYLVPAAAVAFDVEVRAVDHADQATTSAVVRVTAN